MEKKESDQWCLRNELTQGRQLAQKLQSQLKQPSSSSESSQILLQKILNSYENALSLLNQTHPAGTSNHPGEQLPAIEVFREQLPGTGGIGELLPQLNESPQSEDSDPDALAPVKIHRQMVLPKWTRQVKVPPGSGQEGLLEDGFSWRKYGQKDILGCKYPRGYYRCRYRSVQNCKATKQVQKSDDDSDSAIYDITYRGHHTCTQAAAETAQAFPLRDFTPENQEFPGEEKSLPREILLDFRSGLNFNTNPSSSFPVTFPFPAGNESYDCKGGFTSPFISAATGSGFFLPPSPTHSGGLPAEGAVFGPGHCEMSTTTTVRRDNPFSEVDPDLDILFGDSGGYW